jgi:hypothetical protein
VTREFVIQNLATAAEARVRAAATRNAGEKPADDTTIPTAVAPRACPRTRVTNSTEVPAAARAESVWVVHPMRAPVPAV